MKIINAKNAPAAIGPYSHATVVSDLVFTSGQIPIQPETGDIVGEDVAKQTHQVIQNLCAVLNAAGAGLETVVKTTCFLADMNDFSGFNSVYSEFFINKPARSCVAVKALPQNVLVEIEAIAEIKQ